MIKDQNTSALFKCQQSILNRRLYWCNWKLGETSLNSESMHKYFLSLNMSALDTAVETKGFQCIITSRSSLSIISQFNCWDQCQVQRDAEKWPREEIDHENLKGQSDPHFKFPSQNMASSLTNQRFCRNFIFEELSKQPSWLRPTSSAPSSS